MIDDVETFAKIYEAEEGDFSVIHCSKNVVGDADQRRSSGMIWSESMLAVRKKAVAGEINGVARIFRAYRIFR